MTEIYVNNKLMINTSLHWHFSYISIVGSFSFLSGWYLEFPLLSSGFNILTLMMAQMVRSDLLSKFTNLSKRGDGVYTDKSLRDMILNFIIAGRDTTAITLSWFFYMITKNPEVAKNILQELDSCIDQSTSTNIDRKLTSLLWGTLVILCLYMH